MARSALSSLGILHLRQRAEPAGSPSRASGSTSSYRIPDQALSGLGGDTLTWPGGLALSEGADLRRLNSGETVLGMSLAAAVPLAGRDSRPTSSSGNSGGSWASSRHRGHHEPRRPARTTPPRAVLGRRLSR